MALFHFIYWDSDPTHNFTINFKKMTVTGTYASTPTSIGGCTTAGPSMASWQFLTCTPFSGGDEAIDTSAWAYYVLVDFGADVGNSTFRFAGVIVTSADVGFDADDSALGRLDGAAPISLATALARDPWSETWAVLTRRSKLPALP
jgi:hypothetical protein